MTQVFKQHKEERQKLKTTLKESELNTLKGQINPHFMFNSLNNIRGLMLEDVTKSRKMITCLSDMLRYSLAQNKADFIALKDELEMVSNYIALSKIQLENRLQYQQHIDANLLSKNIPPMVIQILLENAIKHGISNVIKGGHINLDVYNLEHQLVIKVTNTGALKSNKMSPKVGLENIKKRLHLLYKDNANFTLYEKDKTVIATIKLPL
jgi:LytS/YehU family sensor histidine kinase